MSFRDPGQVSPPTINSEPVSFAINSKIMLTAFIVILFFLVLMISLHLYSRLYLLRSRSFNLRRFNRSRRTSSAIIFFADPSSTSVDTTSGLDSSVIKSLPIFKFTSAATAPNAIECAVCLSEFEDGETGRVLPNCKHTFHVACIDMWFHSHSSCPLCRSLVQPIAVGLKSAPEQVAVSISDPLPGDDQGSTPELCDTDCLGGAGTSGYYPPEDSQRKPAAIEVPRRILGDSEIDLSRSQSFRSPMSRVRSFTRILSRERRSASSSSIGLPPVVLAPANSRSVTELDMESGGGGDLLTYA